MTEWLRPLLSIALVLGLLAALRWWLGARRAPAIWRRGRGRKGGRLEPLDRLSLTPQHSLHLVRVGNRAVLIGAHPAGCSLLESMAVESAPEEEERPDDGFAGR